MRLNAWSGFAIAAALVALNGCDYDVPITVEPTRRIETSVLGAWTSTDWTNGDCKDQMRIREYDETRYLVVYNGTVYRAWHSDVGDRRFITVQNLDSEERKYSYFAWSLSDNGKRLSLRPVRSDLIPKSARDSVTVVNTLKAHADDPTLFEEAAWFSRKQE